MSRDDDVELRLSRIVVEIVRRDKSDNVDVDVVRAMLSGAEVEGGADESVARMAREQPE